MWQTARMHRVHTSGSIQLSTAASFYRVTCERKRPITEVTKGGRGGEFHCTGDLIDCTITTAHSLINNLPQFNKDTNRGHFVASHRRSEKLIENWFRSWNILGSYFVQVSRTVPNNRFSRKFPHHINSEHMWPLISSPVNCWEGKPHSFFPLKQPDKKTHHPTSSYFSRVKLFHKQKWIGVRIVALSSLEKRYSRNIHPLLLAVFGPVRFSLSDEQRRAKKSWRLFQISNFRKTRHPS